jgi:hypothetical protein
MWLDKRDRGLGLANWTHWYLGQRNDEALREHDKTVFPVDGKPDRMSTWGAFGDEGLLWHQKVMSTQPKWYNNDWWEDAKGCPQPEEERWKPLSDDFRSRVGLMIDEVRKIEAAWTKHFR